LKYLEGKGDVMANCNKIDFGGEMSKIMPMFLREVVKKHDILNIKKELPHTCIVMMDLLEEEGACRMSSIAAALNLSMGAVTGLVDRMIEQGFVERERSAKDRRVVRVVLIKNGKAAIKHINAARKKIANELYAVLTEKEKQEYIVLIRKVFNGIKERDGSQ